MLFFIFGFNYIPFLGKAGLAEAYEFEFVGKDPVLGHAAESAFQVLQSIAEGFDLRILDLTASDAGDMVMVSHLAFEPHLRVPRLDSVYQPGRGQNVEIAINGTHADSGQPFSHLLVDLISRWVGLHFHDFLEDYLSLMGHSVLLSGFQISLDFCN
jgi:hypothetical protein